MLKKNRNKQKTANLQLVKMSNLTLVFNLINERGVISRAELAQETGLSPTTVSSLVDELLDNGMVIETGIGSLSGSGRKPILLEINPAGGYVVAIELCEKGFHFALFDLTGSICEEMFFEISDFSLIGAELIRTIENRLSNNNIDEKKLLGVCIGVPGIIDKTTKRVSSTVLPLNEDNDFFDVLLSRFQGIPVKMGNESCFCAYIEKAKLKNNVHSLVYIDFNVGIGAGIILEDKIFTGAFGNAGEFGHVSVDLNGPRCKCGNRGCLEMTASIPAIEERLANCIKDGRISALCMSDPLPALEDIRAALEAKDALVTEIIENSCRALAVGINNVINIVNPEAIILGGDITNLGAVFLEMLRTELYKIMFKENKQKLIIEYSSVKGNPVTRGAAKYMLDTIFKAGGLLIE